MAPIVVLIFLTLVVLFFVFYKTPKKKVILPDNYQELLHRHVPFYRRLNTENKLRFEEKIKEFLGYIRIEGINTNVTSLDKLLVASSAVIPVFGFTKWKYYNLTNVLLYPDSFNREEFLAHGYEKNTLGMVGTGAMQRTMILSKPALHYGFNNEGGKTNTGIHEFVHLLDKEDGDVDGLPEALLNRKYNIRWLELVNKNIEAIISGILISTIMRPPARRNFFP
jgi:Mlc titration factor MtfA (ptsG expression regulator)